jgi:hypothetical protein
MWGENLGNNIKYSKYSIYITDGAPKLSAVHKRAIIVYVRLLFYSKPERKL